MICFDCNTTCGDGAACSGCNKSFCFSCANITERGFRNLGPDRRAAWRCPKCRISSPRSKTPDKREATLEDIVNRLDILTHTLDELPKLISDVKELKSNMQEVIKSCEFATNKVEDFEMKLVGLHDRVSAMEEIKEVLKVTQSSVDNLQQDTIDKEQWSRLNNVEIKGVPVRNGENLFNIMASLGEHINLPVQNSQINFVTRVPVFNSKEKSILLGFVNRYVKEDFVAAARRCKGLIASDLGFSNCDQRIYVNDHLSPGNKKLLTKAKLTAKEKNYNYVWIKHAKIHIRKNDTSPVLIIKCINDLNKLK
ncbi:unnamed protein product [Plutella xylostella]|uniref:(diamondback moth) hypothetical protein n=1 Tax=Plutella xylostella TaxID=51655 RepID=A0A8S4GCH2_PLUXY|nr:unnamed protein product [Plutella xylostella]